MQQPSTPMATSPDTEPREGMQRRLKRDILFFSIAGIILVFDQLTKSLVRANLPLGSSFPEDTWVRLTHVANTGAAFGLFPDQSFLLLITTLVGVMAITLYYFYPPLNTPLLVLSLGLQLGGALGNLIDRLRLGHVTDFVNFQVWPVFNVADSAIVIGVSILAWFALFGDRAKPASPPESESES